MPCKGQSEGQSPSLSPRLPLFAFGAERARETERKGTLTNSPSPHRIVAFESNVLLKDFGDTSLVPRAFIAGLQGMTCSRVMPTLQPTFKALMARPEELKVLLLLHDGLAHDPDELRSWAREARCIPGFLFWGVYLGNNPQEEAAMRGLLGADRLIACPPGELHLKFGNVLRGFWPVGV